MCVVVDFGGYQQPAGDYQQMSHFHDLRAKKCYIGHEIDRISGLYDRIPTVDKSFS